MNDNRIRIDYMRRLVAGVRHSIDNDPETIEAKKSYGDEITIGRWIDATLLCLVVEDEIINNIRNVIEQAHMTGQYNNGSGVDPSFSEAKNYADSILSDE